MRPAVVATAVVMACALAGCVPTRPIPQPAVDLGAEAQAAAHRDALWALAGLEADASRPTVVVSDGPDADVEGFAACTADGGLVGSWGVRYIGGVGGLFTDDGAGLSDEQRLTFYTCAVRFPGIVTIPVSALTADQTDFLDDHYRRWLIPCLRMHEVEIVGEIPPKERFTRFGDAWSPYDAAVVDDIEQWGLLTTACGAPYGGIELGRR